MKTGSIHTGRDGAMLHVLTHECDRADEKLRGDTQVEMRETLAHTRSRAEKSPGCQSCVSQRNTGPFRVGFHRTDRTSHKLRGTDSDCVGIKRKRRTSGGSVRYTEGLEVA